MAACTRGRHDCPDYKMMQDLPNASARVHTNVECDGDSQPLKTPEEEEEEEEGKLNKGQRKRQRQKAKKEEIQMDRLRRLRHNPALVPQFPPGVDPMTLKGVNIFKFLPQLGKQDAPGDVLSSKTITKSTPAASSLPPKPPQPIGANHDLKRKHGFFMVPEHVHPIPDPTRSLVLEQIPKKHRNNAYVETWARKACGAQPSTVLIDGETALVEFHSPEEAHKAWGSPRLGPENAGKQPHELKGNIREDLIRAYWLRTDGTGAGAGEVEDGEMEDHVKNTPDEAREQRIPRPLSKTQKPGPPSLNPPDHFPVVPGLNYISLPPSQTRHQALLPICSNEHLPIIYSNPMFSPPLQTQHQAPQLITPQFQSSITPTSFTCPPPPGFPDAGPISFPSLRESARSYPINLPPPPPPSNLTGLDNHMEKLLRDKARDSVKKQSGDTQVKSVDQPTAPPHVQGSPPASSMAGSGDNNVMDADTFIADCIKGLNTPALAGQLKLKREIENVSGGPMLPPRKRARLGELERLAAEEQRLAKELHELHGLQKNRVPPIAGPSSQTQYSPKIGLDYVPPRGEIWTSFYDRFIIDLSSDEEADDYEDDEYDAKL